MSPPVRRPLLLLLALAVAPALFAETAEKQFGGRTMAQRFGRLDQGLVYVPGKGGTSQAQTFGTRGARTGAFQFDQKIAPSKYETREFAPKTSWFSKLKFWTKDAQTKEARETSRQAETKTAATKAAIATIGLCRASDRGLGAAAPRSIRPRTLRVIRCAGSLTRSGCQRGAL